MGQIKAIYQGNTFRLQRALELRDKEYLTLEEMSALIEGGKLCTERGVKLLASRGDTPDKARLVEALAITGNSLAARAMDQLERKRESDRQPNESSDLRSSIDAVIKDSFYLARWAERLTAHTGERVFDA